LNSPSLIHLIRHFPELKVGVIGEAMLDAYLEGCTERLCREAPVPVVALNNRKYVPGGAGNTAVNVRSLGAQVRFLSVVGSDNDGRTLMMVLAEKDVPSVDILVAEGRTTLSKNRVIATEQMVVRFDQGDVEPINSMLEDALIDKLEDVFHWSDVFIISDYCYGVITPKVIEKIAQLQSEKPRVVVLDSKRFPEYKAVNLTAVKPNYDEITKYLGKPQEEQRSRIEPFLSQQEQILKLTNAQIVAVTLDTDGAIVFERDRSPYRTYANPVPHSYAAGAGDTFVSALSLALGAGAHTPAAAEIASAASSIVVCKEGTASCYSEELLEHFSTDEKFVHDAFQLTARIAYYRRHGLRVVFTNGCFDILHRGHISYLNKAKEFGDILIVGLNSDNSVRRLKGSDRPINSLEDRGQILSALSCVDHIIPFEEDTPVELIKVINPDVFVKGGDYTRETLPEAPLVENQGGEVAILPYVSDRSTTGIIEKIRQLYMIDGSDGHGGQGK
jgi:D-beta-D-heptose 7-phosphate kinase / D-beta-D-heptose 1-phosphate adenosyltransferase